MSEAETHLEIYQAFYSLFSGMSLVYVFTIFESCRLFEDSRLLCPGLPHLLL